MPRSSNRFDPDCPRCLKPTFAFEKVVDGRRVTLYWCGNSQCDVDAKGKFAGGYWYTLDDMEQFRAGTYITGR